MPSPEAGRGYCRNCYSRLQGEYCASCGQREGHEDLHFKQAFAAIAGDAFSWDSRLWRTLLPLLARPGFLTAEFNAGRRARYVPSFRLYLAISFLTFLALALSTSTDLSVDIMPEAQQRESVSGVNPSSQPQASTSTGENADASGAGDGTDSSASGESNDESVLNLDVGAGAPEWMQDIAERAETNAKRVRAEPGEYTRKLVEYLPQAMFLMLPLFALLLKFAYLLSAFHYFQHLVFALHYHSFVYLLFLLDAALGTLGPNVDGLLSMLLVLYLPLALRRVYSSSWPGAIGKALFIVATYGALLLTGLVVGAIAVLASL